jgi:PAS domain-containing protein
MSRVKRDGGPIGSAPHDSTEKAPDVNLDVGHAEALLKTGALQSAIFNSANFSSIATDAKGVIQIFNVGAERMLGYSASEVMNKITPADISEKTAFHSERFMAEVRLVAGNRKLVA